MRATLSFLARLNNRYPPASKYRDAALLIVEIAVASIYSILSAPLPPNVFRLFRSGREIVEERIRLFE